LKGFVPICPNALEVRHSMGDLRKPKFRGKNNRGSQGVARLPSVQSDRFKGKMMEHATPGLIPLTEKK